MCSGFVLAATYQLVPVALAELRALVAGGAVEGLINSCEQIGLRQAHQLALCRETIPERHVRALRKRSNVVLTPSFSCERIQQNGGGAAAVHSSTVCRKQGKATRIASLWLFTRTMMDG